MCPADGFLIGWVCPLGGSLIGGWVCPVGGSSVREVCSSCFFREEQLKGEPKDECI